MVFFLRNTVSSMIFTFSAFTWRLQFDLTQKATPSCNTPLQWALWADTSTMWWVSPPSVASTSSISSSAVPDCNPNKTFASASRKDVPMAVSLLRRLCGQLGTRKEVPISRFVDATACQNGQRGHEEILGSTEGEADCKEDFELQEKQCYG